MEQFTTTILRRSSDPVVIVGLGEGRVVDVNDAFLAITGYTRQALVGRPGHDLFIGLGEEADSRIVEVLRRLGSVTDVPVGLWTSSQELRVADLSALVLATEGQHDALCTIREVRDPTPEQRRSVAWNELDGILRPGGTWPAVHRALRTLGRCLGWELGALWRSVPPLDILSCVAIWRSPQSPLGPVEEAIRYARLPSPGMEALRQVRLRGEPMWIPDALTDPELSQAQVVVGEPMRGWLAFPILSSEGVIGVVEFTSSETRQPDPELLRILEGFGRLLGRLLEDVEARDLCLVDEAETVRMATLNPSPQTVPHTFRDLAVAVRAASQALERHPTLPHVERTAVLGELTAAIGKLNRLLEQAIRSNGDGPSTLASPAAPTEVGAALPTGLTLKAVSRRTGIPAATLRTWEHRYGFMRPRRSPSGHRLYGEAEIARIEKVKYLVEQGVRIGAAMKAVVEEAADNGLAEESRQARAQSQSREDGKYGEVYRLDPRSPRGRRP